MENISGVSNPHEIVMDVMSVKRSIQEPENVRGFVNQDAKNTSLRIEIELPKTHIFFDGSSLFLLLFF